MTVHTEQNIKKLEREYALLMKLFSEFESFHRQISELTDKSRTDPQAKRALGELKAMLPQNVSDLQLIAMQDLKSIRNAMRKFETYIKEISPSL